ncbi:hypothetical protein TNIN_265791 [Trichonephila inaurata madagascariensis]|uniref:Uncharacterized protein n=1 Tax=Trichonephila inaurata madagascariensis TaxID=2747483 RepID=A0A8X6WS23_9ARAC|nr:hypothetical protein TNIN_395751 [Trichonephila inaurata madagascariensis]GFY39359.1 hypothetical protein TNIN_265791 [Trichonephila inaurata madagascariensis]
MDSYIDLAKPQKLLHRNSSADEVKVVLNTLNATAETLKNVSEVLKHQIIRGELYFDNNIKYKSEHKSRFEDVRCLKTRLQKLLKPFDFIKEQAVRNIGVNLPLFCLLRNPKFECCDAIIESVEEYKRTLWLYKYLLLEINSLHTQFMDIVEEINKEFLTDKQFIDMVKKMDFLPVNSVQQRIFSADYSTFLDTVFEIFLYM